MRELRRDTYHYDFVGYDSYFSDVYPLIEKILDEELNDKDGHFLIAVNEAVCNAAKYALVGENLAHIQINLMVTASDIVAEVKCLTRHFNAEKYRAEIKALAQSNPDMIWSDYTADSDKSRGFWLMLTAVDYLSIAVDGNSITLCVSRPWKEEIAIKTIGDLVPRFLVKQNEVSY